MSGPTAATTPQAAARARGLAGTGPVVYLLYGADSAQAGETDIYAWRFGSTALRRVTHDLTANWRLGVSTMSGTPGGVVFTDGGPLAGGLSIGAVVGTKVHRVAIGGVSRLYSPTLSNTGRLAFSSLRRPNSARHPGGMILVRPRLGRGKLTTIVRQPNHLIADPTWSPRGNELAYLLFSAADYRSRHIVIVDDHGRPVGTIADPTLHAGAWRGRRLRTGLACRAGAEAPSLTRRPSRCLLPRGWTFGCWQPNGTTAIVIDGNRRTRHAAAPRANRLADHASRTRPRLRVRLLRQACPRRDARAGAPSKRSIAGPLPSFVRRRPVRVNSEI